MKYNFDAMTDRSGRLSYKWDIKEGELPMWVADMDFEAPKPVRDALVSAAEHGIYGYSYAPDEYFAAYRDYYRRRHGADFDTADMVYASGIVAALSSMVRKLTTPNEKVLIQAPVFNLFFNSISNNGRRILSSDLVYDGEGYSIDFCDLEAKLSDPETSLMILCNPHNPVGKIWSREELAKIGELCHKWGVTVISDEIHCDFTRPGFEYTPFAMVNNTCRDISVTCISGSKTFNIAGLQSACLVIHNPVLRHRVWRAVNTDEIGEPNVFASVANIAAFTECDEWVDELREYVFENRDIAYNYINEKVDGLRAIYADATYLLWVDISEVSSDAAAFSRELRARTGLYVSSGEGYGEAGRKFIRINLATQRERLMDGLERLRRGTLEIKGEKE